MDRVLVEEVMAGLAATVAEVVATRVGTAAGPIDDACDLRVTRTMASAMVAEGVSPGDLCSAGEVLMLTSDIMNHHRWTLTFEPVADGVSWSYSSLYLRMVALAFTEYSADRPAAASGPRARDLFSAPRAAVVASLANQLSTEGVDRLHHSIRRSLAYMPILGAASPSPYDERGRRVLASYSAPHDATFSSGG